jgi:hypothetical protein
MSCKCAICGYEKAITDDFHKWSDIPGYTAEFYPITKGGKPDSEVINFICARCLKHANSMRVFVKTLMSGVEVSDHAVNRFIERTSADISDKKVGRVAILRAFSKARKIRFQPGYMVTRTINNEFKDAEYYLINDLVFVVTKDEQRTIVTVEKLWEKRLNIDFFFCEARI